MTTNFSFEEFATRLRQLMAFACTGPAIGGSPHALGRYTSTETSYMEYRTGTRETMPAPPDFNQLALELFTLQFAHNAIYRKFCQARRIFPGQVEHWSQIPAVPTAAFKELELSCLAPSARTHVFHSSGTTEHRPSRHFHNAASLAIYETALLSWFSTCLRPDPDLQLLVLTPAPEQAPHSSLVHMFGTIRRQFGRPDSDFVGGLDAEGGWILDFSKLQDSLENLAASQSPVLVLGTAFSYVHLADWLAARQTAYRLPAGSRALETGGYKGRSRQIPRAQLHSIIKKCLGVQRIVCEYGMSELSSQAYCVAGTDKNLPPDLAPAPFLFPPWARVQIFSPETGREVSEGQTGLLRVFDLANVFSVMSIQTEDLAVRRGQAFELVGRAAPADSRGCSLMVA
jgi:acyl-protein synthetase LuxE